jgi:hypothetical protein
MKLSIKDPGQVFTGVVVAVLLILTAWGNATALLVFSATVLVAYSSFAFACALISAKWAMDLGYSQLPQIIFGLGGLLPGPLMLLVLYVLLLYEAKAAGRRAAKMV